MKTLSDADKDLLQSLITKDIHKTLMLKGRVAKQYQEQVIPLPVFLSRREGLAARLQHLSQLRSKIDKKELAK